MDHHRVDRVSLLKLKQQLLHSLGRVVPTKVHRHLLNLFEKNSERNYRG